jgi:hypothetical protein
MERIVLRRNVMFAAVLTLVATCATACGDPTASRNLERTLVELRAVDDQAMALVTEPGDPDPAELTTLERDYLRVKQRVGRTVITGYSQPEQRAWRAIYRLAEVRAELMRSARESPYAGVEAMLSQPLDSAALAELAAALKHLRRP